MRFIYVAAVFMAPVVLMGASPAHADTPGYLRCIKSDAQPPPGVDAKNWLPDVSVIEEGLNSGNSAAQVAQILVGLGVKPSDAVLQVRCVQANWPIGTS